MHQIIDLQGRSFRDRRNNKHGRNICSGSEQRVTRAQIEKTGLANGANRFDYVPRGNAEGVNQFLRLS